MSIAIRTYDPFNYNTTNSIIYFSATTSFERDSSNTVPQHPVDKGVDISDHSSPNNTTYSISGIVSSADVSSNSSRLSTQLLNPVVNNTPRINPVRLVDSNDTLGGRLINRFVPDFISQFFGNTVDIVVDQNGVGWSIDDVRSAILTSLRGVRWNEELERNETYPLFVEILLLDKLGNIREKVAKDLLISNFRDSVTAESGEGLFFDLSLSEARVAVLRTTEVNAKSVSPDVKNAASNDANQGSQPAAKATPAEEAEVESKTPTRSTTIGAGTSGSN